jgi:hypothetical protein
MAKSRKGLFGAGIPAICGWCDVKPQYRKEEDNPGPPCDHYESRENPAPFILEVFCKHCKHPPKCHPGYTGFGSLGPKVSEVLKPKKPSLNRRPSAASKQKALALEWSHELSEIYKKLNTAKVALEKIASCKSVVEGDTVDIAQKALKGLD